MKNSIKGKMIGKSEKIGLIGGVLPFLLVSFCFLFTILKSIYAFSDHRYIPFGFDSTRIIGYTQSILQLGQLDPFSSNRIGLPLFTAVFIKLFSLLPSQSLIMPYWVINIGGGVIFSLLAYILLRRKSAVLIAIVLFATTFVVAPVNDSNFMGLILSPLRILLLIYLLEKKARLKKYWKQWLLYAFIVLAGNFTYPILALTGDIFIFGLVCYLTIQDRKEKQIIHLILPIIIQFASFYILYLFFAFIEPTISIRPGQFIHGNFIPIAYAATQLQLPVGIILYLLLLFLKAEIALTMGIFMYKEYGWWIYIREFLKKIKRWKGIYNVLTLALHKVLQISIPLLIISFIIRLYYLNNYQYYFSEYLPEFLFNWLDHSPEFFITQLLFAVFISKVIKVKNKYKFGHVFHYSLITTASFIFLYYFTAILKIGQVFQNERIILFFMPFILYGIAWCFSQLSWKRNAVYLVVITAAFSINSIERIKTNYRYEGTRKVLLASDWLYTQPDKNNLMVHATYFSIPTSVGQEKFDTLNFIPSKYHFEDHINLGKCDKNNPECLNNFIDFIKKKQVRYVVIEDNLNENVTNNLTALGNTVFNDGVRIIEVLP